MSMKKVSWLVDILAWIPIFISLSCLTAICHAAETVVYSEGFETGNGGYTLDYGTTAEWEWGTPAPNPPAVGPGGAHQGSKAWGTNLDGTIPRPSEGSIVSPAIPLPALGSNQLIRVRFWGFVSLDGMLDRAEFFVSNDGNNWQSLSQFYQAMDPSPAAAPGWRKYEFTLDPSYAGGNIYLRFRTAIENNGPTFYCGGETDLSGFYVDDIAITVYDTTGPRKVFSMEAWEDPNIVSIIDIRTLY